MQFNLIFTQFNVHILLIFETKTKAAELLQQASSMLLPIDQNSPSDAETTSSRPNRASPGTSNMVGWTMVVPELRETLEFNQ